MVLDIRAIAVLAGNTAAAAQVSCSLLSCAQMGGQAEAEVGAARQRCNSCLCTDGTRQSVRLLQRLAAMQRRAPLPMFGQRSGKTSVAAQHSSPDSSYTSMEELSAMNSAPAAAGSSIAGNICARACAALRLHRDAAERVQRAGAAVQEVSLAAAELQLVAESLASCADELCAMGHAKWASKATATELAALQQALGASAGSDSRLQMAAIACCQRMAVMACSAVEAACHALERCMRVDNGAAGNTLSLAGCGRWHLSLQQAQSALLAVRMLHDLGLSAMLIS